MVRLRAILPLCVVPLLSLAAPAPSPFTQYCNKSLHFDCHDSSKPCIPLEWKCDGVRDCPSGLDEAWCSYLHKCPTNMLMCRSGECVPSNFRCDGEIDCSDGTDEKGCEEMEEVMNKTNAARPTPPSSPFVSTVAPPIHCSTHQYQCKNGPCIDDEAKCDGIFDCPGGDDETGCIESSTIPVETSSLFNHCSGDGYLCADRRTCVPRRWVCDGEPDCNDRSDEAHCSKKDEISVIEDMATRPTPPSSPFASTVASQTGCSTHQYQCKNGPCIDVDAKCDGVFDCPSGDDETQCGESPATPVVANASTEEDTARMIQEIEKEKLSDDRHNCNIREKEMDGVVYVSVAVEIRPAPMSTKDTRAWIGTTELKREPAHPQYNWMNVWLRMNPHGNQKNP